jgi:hypothetical protein
MFPEHGCFNITAAMIRANTLDDILSITDIDDKHR